MTVVAGAVVDPRGYSGDLYRWQGGALVGVQGVFHAGLFEFGGTAEAALGGVPLFTETSPARLGAGVLAGTGLHFGKLHPEALVEVGTHAYWGVGPGPGIDGTVPYAGVRLTLALLERAEPSGHRTATLPQLWIFARQDLAQRDGAYQWRSGFDFSGSADAQTSTARIGGVFELGLAVGGGFDVQ